jgi:hypothetical protein
MRQSYTISERVTVMTKRADLDIELFHPNDSPPELDPEPEGTTPDEYDEEADDERACEQHMTLYMARRERWLRRRRPAGR